MREEEYEYLDQLEEHMWWFQGLRGNVENIISRHLNGNFSLLDAGCGTGGMLRRLSACFPEAQFHGIDCSADACARSRRKAHAAIQCGSVTILPYEDESFDAITSLDVLEYDSVDIALALQEFKRCLKKEGLLLLNLPAYQWMCSYHDVAVGQARRFTLRSLENELPKYGFKILFSTYWNTLFFPLMVLRRKIFVRKDGGSDVKPFPPLLESMFTGAIKFEQAVIKKGWRFPFGGSLLVLAERTI